MSPETRIFDFERDFAGTLRCIPMAVRFKLDHSGVKLSLRQWARLPQTERTQLLEMPCDDAASAEHYRHVLLDWVQARTGEQAKLLEIELHPEWDRVDRVPESVRETAQELQVPVPSTEQWAALSPLQRFALLKLTASRHDRDNFPPALREFGLPG